METKKSLFVVIHWTLRALWQNYEFSKKSLQIITDKASDKVCLLFYAVGVLGPFLSAWWQYFLSWASRETCSRRVSWGANQTYFMTWWLFCNWWLVFRPTWVSWRYYYKPKSILLLHTLFTYSGLFGTGTGDFKPINTTMSGSGMRRLNSCSMPLFKSTVWRLASLWPRFSHSADARSHVSAPFSNCPQNKAAR